ncbi:MAG TPA: hypothetical protein VJZ06_08135 [Mobilitalea sp.]|nr:hypothetical protein [Mobilitalea sp.]
MQRKKSSFLAFICSLIPGAGEMYIGFMKKGMSLMLMFWGLIFFSVWLNMGALMFGMPVLWFYSFFEVHNLRAMPDELFMTVKDEYIVLPDFNSTKLKSLQNKYHKLLALVLIIIGVSVLWNNVYGLVEYFLPFDLRNAMYSFGHYFPQLFIGCAIIALGFYLISGKKKELDMNEKNNILEDKGGIIK